MVAAALIVGCRGPADGTTPETWGAIFCGSLGRWSGALADGATDLQSAATETTARHADIVRYLDRIAISTDEFRRQVERAGDPDTADGARIEKAVLRGIAGIGARVQALRRAAVALPTDDPGAFDAAVTGLVSELTAVTRPFDRAMRRVTRLDRDDELSDSLGRLAVCRRHLG